MNIKRYLSGADRHVGPIRDATKIPEGPFVVGLQPAKGGRQPTVNRHSLGCYKGCFYYTDSCFRKDCKKGKPTMRPFPTLLAPSDKSIPGKTIYRRFFGSDETVLVFTDDTAVIIRYSSPEDGIVTKRFELPPTNPYEAAVHATLFQAAGYFTDDEAAAYWAAHRANEATLSEARERVEYERLKAKFEDKP